MKNIKHKSFLSFIKPIFLIRLSNYRLSVRQISLIQNRPIYTKLKYDVQKFIKEKKRDYYETKLEQNIGKPKELWKTLKSLGLPSKKASVSNICLKNGDGISFDDAKNVSIFNEFYSNLAENLVKNLPTPTGKFGISSVKAYYNNIISSSKELELTQITEETIEKNFKS